MKSPSSNRGYAMIMVVFFVFVMALLTASMLSYTISERRANERERLLLRSRNMAENVAIYASEQLTTKLYRLRSSSPMAFMTGSNQIYLPPNSILTTAYSAASDVEVRAGLTSSTPYTLVPSDAAHAGDPNIGLYVGSSNVPIIAKSTMRHPSIGSITSYAEQDLQISMIPLFQFGMFYNMDLELFPGPDMVITGPVHTNGRLMARGEVGGTGIITFSDRVTAAGGLYADGQIKVAYRKRDGSNTAGGGGSGAVNYAATSGTLTNLYSGSVWRDQRWGGSTETATTENQFKTFATSTYTGNVRTNVHGVTKLELPSIGSYAETDDATTTGDDRNNGREIIAVPNSSDAADIVTAKFGRNAGLYIVVNPDSGVRTGRRPDGTSISVLGRSYRCFLNTLNTDGTHTINEVILPGQPSYGYDDNGTPSDASDDKMYQNNLPNRYTDKTAVGVNQILRIPASGKAWDQPIATGLTPASPNSPPAGISFFLGTPSATGYATGSATLSSFPDAIFYDMRRATNNSGYPYNRSTNNYTPRPIAKIDFDMARFKMAVARTISGATSFTGYNLGVPAAGNWSNSVYNPSATTTTLNLGINYGAIVNYSGFPTTATASPNNYYADPFQIYLAPSNATDPLITSNPTTFAVAAASLVNTALPCPWYDGITIYIDSVDAEVRAVSSGVPSRIDSGVRLWNGRGPIASLNGTTYPLRTGFSFATNDAAYIVGHFNADGTINSVTTSTGNGGYSARYPDSASEMLACVMADAITILSQPTFNSSYVQTGGWNDALSAHAVVTSSSYSSSWQTTNPSSSNQYDGLDASKRPAPMPNLSTPAASGTAYTAKLGTVDTEISSALLTGIVPSNHNPTGLTDGPPSTGANQQYSGGAHNYPRMLEAWNGNDLYIRGSMVALFESRVAMEPWNLRAYNAPNRYWGLHQGFRDPAHDLPLEPVVLSAQRMRYRELTSAEYAAQKSVIEALPH